MSQPAYLELLRLAAPEAILALSVVVILAADLAGLRESALRTRRLFACLISTSGCAVAVAWLLAISPKGSLPNGVFLLDDLTLTLKLVILGLTVPALLLSVDWVGPGSSPDGFTPHPAEYASLMLLGALGMMFLVSSENLLMIFVSLELTSLPLYILAGFSKREPASAEAALKYFLLGAVSAAFTLYGFSLLYGYSGSIHLREIAAAVRTQPLDPLLLLALVMSFAGFAFKIAAAPFHFWAPDVYQAAPTPSAAFIASGSKVAGFVILARIAIHGFTGEDSPGVAAPAPWLTLLAAVAAISVVFGNLAAIAQNNVRRLLAYSAVAHAGYTLMGVLSGSAGLASTLYYIITYALTALGAFGVVSLVERQTGGHSMADFAGLNRRDPLAAFCLLVFLLSLAGIPPLAGFFGKFYVFASALRIGPSLDLLWLVILAVAASAVSLYYYLQVAKQAYVVEPAPGPRARTGGWLTRVTVAVLAAAVILLGCFPEWLLAWLRVP